MTKHKSIIADERKIQEIAHYHGIETFIKILKEVAFSASQEMENINMAVSNQYRELANHIDSLELSSGEE